MSKSKSSNHDKFQQAVAFHLRNSIENDLNELMSNTICPESTSWSLASSRVSSPSVDQEVIKKLSVEMTTDQKICQVITSVFILLWLIAYSGAI